MSNQTTDYRKRLALSAERSKALAAGDAARYQALTLEIAQLPMKGVRPLTAKDIAKYVARKQK